MIISESLPQIKLFFRALGGCRANRLSMLARLVAAFLEHAGKMSASQAAEAIASDGRHRANVGRFLAQSEPLARQLNRLQRSVLRSEVRRFEKRRPPARASKWNGWFLVLDQTFVGHQGEHLENAFSRANYRPRKRSSNRRQKKTARHSCHCLVMGLLLTPYGTRIPLWKSYYTKEYCQAQGRAYRTQTAIAADLVRELPLPPGTPVTVLGDTAYDAQTIRTACRERGYGWIVPINPERVLEGPRGQRPKVSSLACRLQASMLVAIRLAPHHATFAAQRRVAACRRESRTQVRTFYVHGECHKVRRVGPALLVFSTTEKPAANQPVKPQKLLMTSHLDWPVERVVRAYDLRWQIELMFKELKSTLGLADYQLRSYRKVEGYVTTCLIAFLYLEWYRRRRLERPTSVQDQLHCASQRTYGLCRLVRQHAHANDLNYVVRKCRSPRSLRKLQRQLERAIPLEYRTPSRKH